MSEKYVFKTSQIFPKMYYEFQWVKGLQTCGLSNFEDDSIVCDSIPGRTRVAEFFSNVQLWELVILQPFDLHTSLKYIVPVHKAGSILKVGFLLSKWPYFKNAYVLGVFVVFSETVASNNQKIVNMWCCFWWTYLYAGAVFGHYLPFGFPNTICPF